MSGHIQFDFFPCYIMCEKFIACFKNTMWTYPTTWSNIWIKEGFYFSIIKILHAWTWNFNSIYFLKGFQNSLIIIGDIALIKSAFEHAIFYSKHALFSIEFFKACEWSHTIWIFPMLNNVWKGCSMLSKIQCDHTLWPGYSFRIST